MTTAPTTPTTRPATGDSFLARLDHVLAPRFGSPGSISLAVSAMRRRRRHRG